MTRQDKVDLIEDLTQSFKEANAMIICDYRGLQVKQLESLRKIAKDSNIRVQVIKNKLAAIALKQAGFLEVDLKDTNIYIWSNDQIVLSKIVCKFQEENAENFSVKFGYFDNDEPIYNELKSKSPKLILVALGSPKQEEFIYKAKKILNPALMIGIGGSLDVWSGMIKRAPRLFQILGLEWLYRTAMQPSRIKRIFPTLPVFLIRSFTKRSL